MRARLAPLFLAALAACSGAVDPAALDPYADTVHACRATFDAFFSRADRCGIATPLAESWYDASAFACEGLDRPTVTQDTSHLRACAEALAVLPCWIESPPECDLAFTGGTVGPGGACVSDVDCQAGLYGCLSETNACGGVCRAFGATGDRCDVGDPPCGKDYYCGGGAVPLCEPRVGQGQPCSGNSACQDGLRCDPALGTSCERVLGGPCTSSWECDTSDRGAYYCPVWEPIGSFSMQCRALGSVEADADRCGGGKDCAADRWCDATEMRCNPRQLSGPCTSDTQCLEPARCIDLGGGEGECRVLVKIGDACTIGQNECELGAYCGGPGLGQQGVCHAWPGPGEECGVLSGEWVQCLGGWCKDDGTSSSGHRCSPYSKLGDYCFSGSECGPADDMGPRTCTDNVCAVRCPE